MLALGRCITVALAVVVAGAGVAVADDRPGGGPVSLQVWAIRATTKNKDISPELKEIADKLKAQFRFTGFKLEQRQSGSAAIGKTFETSLTGGYTARITPKSSDGKRVELQIQVVKDKKAIYDTTLRADAGKFVLQGGWDLDGGDKLIVAVAGR